MVETESLGPEADERLRIVAVERQVTLSEWAHTLLLLYRSASVPYTLTSTVHAHASGRQPLQIRATTTTLYQPVALNNVGIPSGAPLQDSSLG